MIGKVRRDLAGGGVGITDRMLRHQLREMALKAYLQLTQEQARRPARPQPWPRVKRARRAG